MFDYRRMATMRLSNQLLVVALKTKLSGLHVHVTEAEKSLVFNATISKDGLRN
jgi:hypothetical protein